MLPIVINILLVIHVLVSLLIILIVLMQRPKNEGLGAAFGGGMTENLFGAQTTNVLQTITRWLGGIFFVLTLALSILYVKQGGSRSAVQEKLSNAPVPAAPTPLPATPAPGTSTATDGTAPSDDEKNGAKPKVEATSEGRQAAPQPNTDAAAPGATDKPPKPDTTEKSEAPPLEKTSETPAPPVPPNTPSTEDKSKAPSKEKPTPPAGPEK
jgi:preprotein translocase subunit SecG